MEKIPIQKLLRAVYDEKFKNLEDFTVVIRHRGAKDNKKNINGKRIESVEKSGFWYVNRFKKKTFIPAHRILEILENI